MDKLFVSLVLLVAAPVAFALDFATARGPHLVNSRTSGTITMNGIWYLLSNYTTDTAFDTMDSLKDAKACTRDAALMAQLGINTIYVMAIEPKLNHDACFSIFNSVGIYVMIVLRTDGVFSTSYEDFAKSYTTDFLKGMFQIIDAVKDYENVLGFDLGVLPVYTGYRNEVNGMLWPDMMKTYRAFVRDTKAYIAYNAQRPILVGTNLYLKRDDELLDASYLTRSHLYYFSCSIDGTKSDMSRSDYISIRNLGFFEEQPVEKQNRSYTSYHEAIGEPMTPVWFSSMGVFAAVDNVEYELRPNLLDDTLFLYNSSSNLQRFTGGVRPSWTNTNAAWKIPKVNWELTITAPDGSVRLTRNFQKYRDIFDRLPRGSWLSGSVVMADSPPPRQCDASATDMANRTETVDGLASRTTITMATDWALPTRPSGVDALITSGVGGKRGQMIDVTVTTIAYAVKDSNGRLVTDLVLKPSSSQSRILTSADAETGPPTGSPSSPLSMGARAGIGVGTGVCIFVAAAGLGFWLLRRQRNIKAPGPEEGIANVPLRPVDLEGFHKAELATGPEVEQRQPELSQDTKTFYEVPENPRVRQNPVELPATERPAEVPNVQTRGP